MDLLVKLHGVPEKVLLELVEKGYFKTKTEAIRHSIVLLGRQYACLADSEAPLHKDSLKNHGVH